MPGIERNIDPNAKPGLRIKLIKMHDDPRPVDEDMEGTISHVDSIGTIHVNWDDGRILGVIPNQDEYVLYPPSNQGIDNLDDVFEASLTSIGKDKAVINKSMPKPTLRGAQSTKGGKNVNKNFKSNLSKAKVRDIKVEDKVKGGKADKMTPQKLAKKHGVSIKDIEKEIKVGIKIEMEHTGSKSLAKEIAMDHIAEFPDYYTNEKYGTLASEKGLEKVHEVFSLKDLFKKTSSFDTETDYNLKKRFISSVKKINDSIDSAKPQQAETLYNMVKTLENSYKGKVTDDKLFYDLIGKLMEKISSKFDLEETTMTSGGISTGAFIGPLEPKNENKIIKAKDFLSEIVDTKLTKIRDAGSGYESNPWVGDREGDGWVFNNKPAWPGGKIVDILAKLDINWVDDDLSVTTNESFQKAIKSLVSEVEGKDIHTAKWKRCFEKVSKEKGDEAAAGICTDSIGYEGSIKKVHRKKDKEEIEETTTFASALGDSGTYVTPAFAAAKGKHGPSKKPIWKGGTIVQDIKSDDVLVNEVNTIKWVKGGKFVKIKDKCAKYRNNEHCSQGAIDDPLELSDTAFKNVQEVAKKMGISENDIMSKIKAKLKGVSKKQMEYNKKHSLPLDWEGSKEGYYEYIENKRNYSGSN